MKLTTQVKLIISREDKQSLLETMEQFNEVCNGISKSAFEYKVFRQYDIHQMLYHPIRDCFDLSAQLVVRAISKVADSYKLDIKKIRKFREHGAITYDSRILTWKDEEVSIWAIGGRKKFSYLCGERQKEQLKFQKGESDLIYKNGDFFLYTTCEVPEKEPVPVEQYLGVDLGITNIATDSLEKIYSGSHISSVRIRNLKLRAKLQSKGTKSAKNLLKKRSKKERRFAKDINHQISKKIVETAQRHSVGIALENLKGIRSRVTVRKGLRYQLHSWAFNDLAGKIWYKARKEGIEVILVDPRYTSQECSSCGHTKKSNRKSQSLFSCQSCGYTVHADINAACVISSRAAVNRPNVVGEQSPNYKPLPLGRGG
ncbi:MAG: transposase [Epsilonproteobacteria bacterium]|nr:MAG: transposase [Campylobacterota bacterium]RLA67642.1 MAG: transposase [Campylobacterota bacterium]